MKTLVRICLIVCLAFVVSGCGFVQMVLTGHPQPYPPRAPGETFAPLTPEPSLGTGMTDCVIETWALAHTPSQPVNMDILDQTQTIIQLRLAGVGIPAVISLHQPDQYSVTTPAWADAELVRNLVGQMGRLDFVIVPDAFATVVMDRQPLPAGMPQTIILSGDQIAAARPGTDTAGLPAVDIELKAAGAKAFDAFAATAYDGTSGGVKFAVVLDGIVESALGLNSNSFGGAAQISGNFSQAQVDLLVAMLRYGTLPLPVTSVQSVPGSCAAIGS